MAEYKENYGLFWNSSSSDRVYDASSFELWLKKFYREGVFKGGLEVTAASGMTVTVSPGYCDIDGKVGIFPTATSVTLDVANSRYPRIDNIVIERNDKKRDITIKAIAGLYSSTSPHPSPPTRAGGVYQMVLARVYVRAGAPRVTVDNITDTRQDESICGIVTGFIEGLSEVATSGSISDLTGVPTFARVAYSGKYTDLTNRPSLAAVATSGNYADLMGRPNFSRVATTGDYNDLKNKPPIENDGYIYIGPKYKAVLMMEDNPGYAANSICLLGSLAKPPSDYSGDEDTWIKEHRGNNIAIRGSTGHKDAYAIGFEANAQGPYSIAIGYNAIAIGDNSVAIGDGSYASGANSVALGTYSKALTNDTIQLGQNGIRYLRCRVPLTVRSDQRDKADIETIDHALDFLNRLNAVSYVRNERTRYLCDERELSEEDLKIRRKYGLYKYDKKSHADGRKKGTHKRAGVVAQEVIKAMGDAYGDASYANLVDEDFHDEDKLPEGVETQLLVNYEGFIPFLVKAVQELSELVNDTETFLETAVESRKEDSD